MWNDDIKCKVDTSFKRNIDQSLDIYSNDVIVLSSIQFPIQKNSKILVFYQVRENGS